MTSQQILTTLLRAVARGCRRYNSVRVTRGPRAQLGYSTETPLVRTGPGGTYTRDYYGRVVAQTCNQKRGDT